MTLNEALRRYECALDVLRDTPTSNTQCDQGKKVDPVNLQQQVLKVLERRDSVQAVLENTAAIAPQDLITLQGLDKHLQDARLQIVRAVNLKELRSLRNPPAHYWWWHFEPPALFPFLEKQYHWLDRLDWLWTFLSLFALTLSFTIVLDTLNRVVGEGFNAAGMLPVVVQILLTIAGGAAALTSNGRKFIQAVMERLRIPKHYWAETSALVSGLVLLAVAAIFTFYIPQLAIDRHTDGIAFYEAGQFDRAMEAYQQAIALQPDFVAAHYSLGVLQEDLQRGDEAIAEYQLVTRSNPDALDKLTWLRAHNNLGRLYILNGDYTEAWTVLERAESTVTETDLTSEDMRVESYNLLKNLGWVWLQQERFVEADETLLEAINLNAERSAAHCLRAQALEGLQQSEVPALEPTSADIADAWDRCLRGERKIQPEEAEWAAIARERLLQE